MLVKSQSRTLALVEICYPFVLNSQGWEGKKAPQGAFLLAAKSTKYWIK